MESEIEKQLAVFDLTEESMLDISSKLEDGFRKGLDHDPTGFLYSPIKMIPTWLSVVPDGSETGRFFGLDVGGSTVRCLEIDVVDGELSSRCFSHSVPNEIMTGTVDELFDFIAQKIQHGLKEFKMDKPIHRFGFTFSFPVSQPSLLSGILIRWTKGYDVKGVVGEDVCVLLKKSCVKLGLQIDEFVLINDTTGTLMSGAFGNKNAVIGIINGTGTNACYMEKSERVSKWLNTNKEKQVIINTEWGAFGEAGELKPYCTEYDIELDASSLRPGEHIFEKMISGMYIGEIARLIIVKFTNLGYLFDGKIPEALKKKDSLSSAVLSHSYDQEKILKEFKRICDVDLSTQDLDIIRQICDKVSLRAGRLTASGLLTILNRIDYEFCVIACDGSMFRKHPKFVQYVQEALSRIAKNKKFKIVMADDGSGKGAALAAAVATISEQKRASSENLVSS